MTTDEMLIEIVKYKYKSAGFPCVFLDDEAKTEVIGNIFENPELLK